MKRVPLLYALHSGNLYGTERMALATAQGLADQYHPMILAPAGPVQDEARRMGLDSFAFHSAREFTALIHPVFAQADHVALIATGIVHSFCAMGVNAIYRRRLSHLHVVHGGTDERLSYGRKRLLNRSSALLVAVSDFVRDRLIAHGARETHIRVIENFLPEARSEACPRRGCFSGRRLCRALVISRVDPIKRVDLLLEALDRDEELRNLQVRVLGTGWELESLRARAKRNNPNVIFAGFVSDIENELARADLLVHLCPAEPFGLAILEALAADVPVTVPDQGGAGSLVEDGVTGFRFRANDSASLAAKLLAISRTPAAELNALVSRARALLHSRFSPHRRIDDYRQLLEEGFA